MRSLLPLLLCFGLACVQTVDDRCKEGSCQCEKGATCSFQGCGPLVDHCTYGCDALSDCSGSCGDGCVISCEATGVRCAFTVGDGGQVDCGSNRCVITCLASCSVTGDGGVTVTCAGQRVATGCR